MPPLMSPNASRSTAGLQDVPQGQRAHTHGARTAQTRPSPPTILIVEDEPSIARALTQLLRRDGYQAEVAPNGQEALSACQRQAYTQILCDLWMPVLDGQGFYEALQRCQPQLCARVVFLTGDTLTPAVHAFLARTRVPMLAKPFTAARLRALLTERCDRPRPA